MEEGSEEQEKERGESRRTRGKAEEKERIKSERRELHPRICGSGVLGSCLRPDCEGDNRVVLLILSGQDGELLKMLLSMGERDCGMVGGM